MACCNNISRWLIGIASICVIICAVVAAVYVYTHEKNRDWAKLIKSNIPFIFILVAMAFAIISSIIGFLVCCRQTKTLYIIYMIIICVVIVVEIAAIVLAFKFKDKIIDGIDENWYKEKYDDTRVSIEEKLKCCGFKSYNPITSKCGYTQIDSLPTTCFDKLKSEIDNNMKNLKIAAVVMAVVEIILLICAVYLACCDKAQVSN